jgi:hypothetical protein
MDSNLRLVPPADGSAFARVRADTLVGMAFSNVIAIAIIIATAAKLPLPPQKRSSLDSPLEGTGFEPSVPRKPPES